MVPPIVVIDPNYRIKNNWTIARYGADQRWESWPKVGDLVIALEDECPALWWARVREVHNETGFLCLEVPWMDCIVAKDE